MYFCQMLKKNSIIHYKSLLIAIFLAFGTNGFSQSLKGLYVDDFFNIIGNQTKEDQLLSYARSNGFNYLILYNTAKIHREKYPLDSKNGSLIWKNFIHKAKSDFAIQKIGVVGEKAASFIPANIYNKNVNQVFTDRIDVYNLEFEFWNKRLYDPMGYYCTTYLSKQNYDCTNDGAFKFYIRQLQEMRKMTTNSSIETETYIGNPTDEQLAIIAKNVDRLLIHYYRENTDWIASYKLNRLLVLQQSNPKLKIAPIFSSRENHSGPWLKTHKIDELPALYFNQLKSIPEINFKSLNFDGHVWYRYTDMPKNK